MTVELTANDNTIYNFIWVDTKKGPLVVEVPPKVLGASTIFGIAGSPTWASQVRTVEKAANTSFCHPAIRVMCRRAISSCARALGNWLFFRAFLVEGSTKPGVALVKEKLKIYQLPDAANPPAIKFVNARASRLSSSPPATTPSGKS